MSTTPINYLTPYRWYNQYFKQSRFEKDCDMLCGFDLLTDKNHLLPFQFTRQANPNQISDWYLRPACNDPFKKVWSDADANFVTLKNWTVDPGRCGGSDAHPVMCASFEKDCDSLRSQQTNTGAITYNPAPLTNGVTYKLFIKISEWANPGTNFTVELHNGATVIRSFTGYGNTGVYEIDFTATGSDFHIEFYNRATGDYIVIDEITILNPFVLDLATDYVLDQNKINVSNVGGINGIDYVIYRGIDLEQAIRPGTYYSIIRFTEYPAGEESNEGTYVSEGYAYYFSEVITVKDFLPDASPYIRLEWYNDCDIEGTSYPTGRYINWLYIDGVLTKPEYPITEKGQTDGNENFNATFQKWNKKRELQLTKVPEFLIDSLTAIRLHSNIVIYEAIRDNEQMVNMVFDIQSVEHEINWILNDCRATFTLKCLLADKVVDETCCKNIAFDECIECNVTAQFYYNEESPIPEEAPDEGTTAVFENVHGYDDGYYIFTDGDWVLQELQLEDIVCIPDSCFMFSNQGQFVRCPSIFDTLFNPTAVRLRGYILPNTYAQAEYSIDGGSTWNDVGSPVDQEQFMSTTGLEFIRPNDSPACGDTLYRVKMFDLNCGLYCTSDSVTATDTAGC